MPATSFSPLRNRDIVAIVQARMGSTRLPEKVLLEVLGKPLLAYLLERLERCQTLSSLVVATTIDPSDDRIVNFCANLHYDCFRGSEEDLLQRYKEAAKIAQADIIVRVTGDCPLIDPQVIDKAVTLFCQGKFDYLSNTIERTFPRGMDVEVFSIEVLERIDLLSQLPEERGHVTPYIYRHPEQFRIGSFNYSENYSRYRWTVDTAEDFLLIKTLLEAIYPQKPQFTLEDLLQLIESHPEWTEINQHISQKPL